MTHANSHRLDGLEPDNLLAFLALLGLLRALETADEKRSEGDKLFPRAGWPVDPPPLRPYLQLKRAVTPEEVAENAAKGIEAIAATHDFGGRKDLNHTRSECRTLLQEEASAASLGARRRVDLLAALMNDAAIKDAKKEAVDPTPLCMLFVATRPFHFAGTLRRTFVMP